MSGQCRERRREARTGPQAGPEGREAQSMSPWLADDGPREAPADAMPRTPSRAS